MSDQIATFQRARSPQHKASPSGTATVASVLARSFAERPLLCDLIAHVALNLERHVSIVARLAGSTWQIANPPGALAELYRSDPALRNACIDLERDLERSATLVLAGLLAGQR